VIRHRHALSLIEVVLSMSLLSIAVIVLVMALPAALRVQERSRFQLYAAAKGLELVDRLLGETAQNSGPTDGGGGIYSLTKGFTFESAQPWDTPGGRRVLDPDLELRAAIHGGALVPMPRELAYRLDSPDDEIRKLLDAGGQLYVANPTSANPLTLDGPLNPRPPSESMRMVVAVQGYAQQNAIQHYPWKDWPYYVAYPSPPIRWYKGPSTDSYNNYTWRDERFSVEDYTYGGDVDALTLYESNLIKNTAGVRTFDYDGAAATEDKDRDGVLDPKEDLNNNGVLDPGEDVNGNGALDPAEDSNNNGNIDVTSDRNSGTGVYTSMSGLPGQMSDAKETLASQGWLQAKSQLMLALWYGWRKGLPSTVLYGQATAAEIATCAQDPQKVRALRYLAFAGACMTKWYPLAAEGARPGRTFPWRGFDDWQVYWSGAPRDRTPAVQPRPQHDGLRAGIPIPGDDDPAMTPELDRVWLVPPSGASLFVLSDIIAIIGAAGPTSNPFASNALPAAPAGHPMLSRLSVAGIVDASKGQLFVTAAVIANWHETCLGAVMTYAASNPYDWSEPRPFERQLFTDHPLIQWDICSDDLLYGLIGGTPELPNVAETTARQWRPIAARPITNQGWNRVYTEGVCIMPSSNPAATMVQPQARYSTTAAGASTPTRQDATYSTIKGNESHFNLALPFDPSERCRQMVFYSVDWTAWLDFETTASAPQDAARYPRWNWDYAVQKGSDVTNPTKTLSGFMGNCAYMATDMPFMRNPEIVRLFVLDQTNTPTGTNVLYHTAGPDSKFDTNQAESAAYVYPATGGSDETKRVDLGFSPQVAVLDGVTVPGDHPRRIFSGLYGADRNGNGRLDRGPLSTSVRLRAIEVGRLNYYDPRLSFTLR